MMPTAFREAVHPPVPGVTAIDETTTITGRVMTNAGRTATTGRVTGITPATGITRATGTVPATETIRATGITRTVPDLPVGILATFRRPIIVLARLTIVDRLQTTTA